MHDLVGSVVVRHTIFLLYIGPKMVPSGSQFFSHGLDIILAPFSVKRIGRM